MARRVFDFLDDIFGGVDRKNLVPGDVEIAPRKVALLFNNNNNSWA